MWNKTLSLFAIACMSAIVTGPTAIVLGITQLNEFPGRFTDDTYGPGDLFRALLTHLWVVRRAGGRGTPLSV
ncbi:hypothetical protein MF406_04450 [Georgenia sp. TF02-10]|uniref:hypothetical protein n=1 Tax=Georgenia sp. TF02-10 TaxID=2917725 RepID=UPI001FA7D518|nr:hypothetical protein [Georgenia sp. TF02-10]UNX55519.1 hypothetical protein MF406_04450 [Georgenia sp. TF02-10]